MVYLDVFKVSPQMTGSEYITQSFHRREEVPEGASSAQNEGDLWRSCRSSVADGSTADFFPSSSCIH